MLLDRPIGGPVSSRLGGKPSSRIPPVYVGPLAFPVAFEADEYTYDISSLFTGTVTGYLLVTGDLIGSGISFNSTTGVFSGIANNDIDVVNLSCAAFNTEGPSATSNTDTLVIDPIRYDTRAGSLSAVATALDIAAIVSSTPDTRGSSLTTPNVSVTATEVPGAGGALSNNDSYTITGTGFGTKTTAAPIVAEDFQSYTTGATLQASNASWIEYGTTGGALVSTANTRYSGSKSARNDSTRNGFATNYVTYPVTDKVHISYWWRTDGAVYTNGANQGGTYWVGKLSRITSTVSAGGGGPYNGTGVTALSNANPAYTSWPYLSWTNGVENLPNPGYYMKIPAENKWIRVDMYSELGSLHTANGKAGVKVWNYSEVNDSAALNRRASFQLNASILGLMFANHTGPDAGLQITDFYLDNTRQRVELCNSSNFTTATHAERQPATAWSSTSITVTIKTGSFPPGEYYLHVIDGSGASVHNELVEIT